MCEGVWSCKSFFFLPEPLLKIFLYRDKRIGIGGREKKKNKIESSMQNFISLTLTLHRSTAANARITASAPSARRAKRGLRTSFH